MLLTVGFHASWSDFFGDPNVKLAMGNIEAQLSGEEFYPLAGDVLRFALVDLAQVRYVFVGQDPYPSFDKKHGRPQATGRSFEVSELVDEGWDCPIRQSSLRNMLKAIYYAQTDRSVSLRQIREAITTGEFDVAPPGVLFDSLERQGALFLNATLTVPPGKPGAHHKLWEGFRSLLVSYIVERNPSAIWMLWGKKVEDLIGPLPKHVEAFRCCHPRLSEFVEQSNLKAIDVNWT